MYAAEAPLSGSCILLQPSYTLFEYMESIYW